MALMAFSDSEVHNDKSCSKTCLKNYETLKKQCDDLIVKLNQTEFTTATYKRGLATVEEPLITYRKNEVLFSEEVAVLKREVSCKDYEINVLKSEFEKVKQEKEGIEFKIEKFDKASKDLDKLLGSEITDKSKKGLGYSAVPPPYLLIYNRPKKLDLSYSSLDEFKEPEFKAYGSEVSKQESNVVCEKKSDDSKENSDDSLVKDQVSKDTSSFVESSLNVDKETIFPVDKKVEFIKPKNHEKPVKKLVRASYNRMTYDLLIVDAQGRNNGTEFKNKVMDDFCREKSIKMEYSVAKTPQQNGVAERRNKTLIEAARTMLADSKLPTTFWAEAVSTACYVQNRVLVVKPHNKTLMNFLEFDGKSDEGFFVGYSLSSKAFRVYNTRTRRVEENLHIWFLENKPMIEGNGSKWLFDIDSLTQSMNYVPVAAGTIINESDVDNGEPKSTADDQKQIEDGPDNKNDEKDKYKYDNSPKEVNTAGQHVNTASPEVNTSHFKLNIVRLSVNTASSYDQDSPKDMFSMGASHILEAAHVEFFSDEDEPEVDLGSITNSYTVPTTPNTRIHKDHPIENMIRDVKSSVQTRRMTNILLHEQGYSIEPTSIAKVLSDSSWVDAMQEELLQFKLQQVWILVDLPIGKRAIGTKWVFRNKKDERGIMIMNKARLVAQGYRQEEDVKSASTPVDLEKPLVKDGDADDIDISSYSKDITSLSFAYTDSDYAGATQDRKSTTGGCQFLGNRLISWQCKKQTVVATSTTEAEYVAAASCRGQVLWIQNQLLDYGHVKRGRDTKIPQSSGPPVTVGDELSIRIDDRIERAANYCF
ncbi:putative ribonuclease H-like domain-containing protein [Tanacetum coccineum]